MPALPHPLDAAPTRNAVAARGLVFDIDDTVTEHGRLSPRAFDAMWRARRSGLQLVAVTGRPLGWADVVARHWPVDIAIGENGAGWAWVDAEHRFRRGYFDPTQVREMYRARLDSISETMRRELPHVHPANDSLGRRCDLAFDAYEEAALDSATVARAREIIEAHGASCVVSSVHIHAVPGDWDKAAGTRAALSRVLSVDLESENERWWFVGDSGNDEAAFAYFHNSVGVANVRERLPELKSVPRYITHAMRGAGFAELVDFLLARLTP